MEIQVVAKKQVFKVIVAKSVRREKPVAMVVSKNQRTVPNPRDVLVMAKHFMVPFE